MLRIKELRLARGMTQEQVASLAGIDQSRVSALESEANPNPTLQTIVALARALGVEPPQLFPALRDDALDDNHISTPDGV